MTFSTDDFARALAAHDYNFQAGSVVKGTVIGHGSEGAYVEIGGKSDAFVPLKEASLGKAEALEELLPLQSEWEFMIIREQDNEGRVLLSIRRLLVQQLWEKLTQQQSDGILISTRVTGINKGGVIVDVEGLRGFVPRSHLSHPEDLEALVGTTLTVGFLEVDPERNKLVLSAKIAARSQAMGQLEVGQLVTGTVVSLKPYGAFVEFEGVTGLLHVNQISKNYVDSLPNVLKLDQPLKAIVVALDAERNRISLSTKVLEKYPGEMIKEPDVLFAEAEDRSQNVEKMLSESDA
ncbi:S1 RNA-binding domain-containing protein [Leptolyngbya sp. PCC 6406]|uniref:S1 RNA-binding domain-containing protein n=1 Tax=Leptolyngbya sp. PCC 6406 TaxID=1173264 RepID=UPI0002AC5062|nr:S1 RNA-binding domain-containing protein [Leptolyngbya sp. PCC 6406]